MKSFVVAGLLAVALAHNGEHGHSEPVSIPSAAATPAPAAPAGPAGMSGGGVCYSQVQVPCSAPTNPSVPPAGGFSPPSPPGKKNSPPPAAPSTPSVPSEPAYPPPTEPSVPHSAHTPAPSSPSFKTPPSSYSGGGGNSTRNSTTPKTPVVTAGSNRVWGVSMAAMVGIAGVVAVLA